MKTIFFKCAKCAILIAALALFTAPIDSAYAQEGSSANLRLVPTQERIPQADWRINPEYIIPPIGSQPYFPAERRDPATAPSVRNSPTIKVHVISELEQGKWYVQIGAYTKPEHVDETILRVGTASPVVVLISAETNPMYRVLLGPFTQNESKSILQNFRDKGYEAFLRSGN